MSISSSRAPEPRDNRVTAVISSHKPPAVVSAAAVALRGLPNPGVLSADVVVPLDPSRVSTNDVEVEIREVPRVQLTVYKRLPSGETVSVRMAREANENLEQAFINLKDLLTLPAGCKCRFNLFEGTVGYSMGGVQYPDLLDLRVLVAKSPDPEAALEAVHAFARASEASTGRRVPFTMKEARVSDTYRVHLRRPGITTDKRSVLTQLPPLLSQQELLDETKRRASYREHYDRAFEVAKRSLSPGELMQGAHRVGIVESMLFNITNQMRAGRAQIEAELQVAQQQEAHLRTQLSQNTSAAFRAKVTGAANEVTRLTKRLKQLDRLLEKINVDRFALYLGLFFSPDSTQIANSEERMAAADARALELTKAVEAELEQFFKAMQPSWGARFKAHLLFTDSMEQISPIPDAAYASKVGSLVYAHLPNIEARIAAPRFLAENCQYASGAAFEAGLVELAHGSMVPKQLNALMEELAQIMHPTDKPARDAVIQTFRKDVMEVRARPAPVTVSGALTANEIEARYLPQRGPTSPPLCLGQAPS